MLIDPTHRGWIKATIVVFLLAAVGYIPYALLSVRGAQGGSAVGLIYGSVGSALMVFAGLLGARKKVPTWRLGRASNWMCGHLRLGLLSFPSHSLSRGLRLGTGSLTRALMVFSSSLGRGILVRSYRSHAENHHNTFPWKPFTSRSITCGDDCWRKPRPPFARSVEPARRYGASRQEATRRGIRRRNPGRDDVRVCRRGR